MKNLIITLLCSLPMLALADDSDLAQAEYEYEQEYKQGMKKAEQITGYHFSDYNVPIYHGKKAPLDKKDDLVRTFRTRIYDSYAEGKIDFAGKYIMSGWGCGTSCSSGALIDKSTGKVYPDLMIGEGKFENYNIKPKYDCSKLTTSISGDPQYFFNPNSRLVIVPITCLGESNKNPATKVIIYNVLEWQEKRKEYKLLHNTFIREPIQN